jgi:DNA-binding transcriptional regulator LsrR (DeoR family)
MPTGKRKMEPAQNMNSDQAPSPQDIPAVSTAKIVEGFERYFKERIGMPTIAQDLHISQAVFRHRLREAYEAGAILFRMPRNRNRAQKLLEQWPNVRYYVLDSEGDLFYRGAAEVFFDEMRGLLHDWDDENRPLRLGVVSGRTTGGMIEAICSVGKPWRELMPLERLPRKTCVYALNVSQTDGYSHLRGNASVLAFELARRLSSEVRATHYDSTRTIEAYGLSADLLQQRDEAMRTDCSPQVKAVLRDTDPCRLRQSMERQGEQADAELASKSQLDVVITGAGSIGDSLFTDYCEQHRFPVAELRNQKNVVGDIAYNPVTRTGNLVVLTDQDGKEYVFYSAISLQVLTEMSSDPLKRVMLVARGKSKIDPIHAAIAPDAHLCNVLITDVETAYNLSIEYGVRGTGKQ